MKMPKPTDEDRERFHRLVPDDPRVQTKPMFGNLGAFVNGNMFMALLGADVGVKLDEESLEEIRAIGGGPWGPGGPLREYVALPPAMADDPEAAAPIVERALEYVGAFPPKEKKPRQLR